MVDLELTITGDLVVDSNGDLKLVYGDDALIQQVMFRLKTVKGDWLLSRSVGVSLEEFIGATMTDAVYAGISSSVVNELNNIPEVQNLQVKTAPLSANSVGILVEFDSINIPKSQVSLVFNLDLKTGLVFLRQ